MEFEMTKLILLWFTNYYKNNSCRDSNFLGEIVLVLLQSQPTTLVCEPRNASLQALGLTVNRFSTTLKVLITYIPII